MGDDNIKKSFLLVIFLLLNAFGILQADENIEGFLNSRLAWFGQSSFIIISKAGKVLYIDPVKVPNNYAQADLILVTHSHYDHLNQATVKRLQKEGTVIIGPASLAKPGWIGFTEWQTIKIGDYHITGIPAYNINKNYHPQSQHWLGYIIEVDGIKIYHAGDTDLIPEMRKIHCDIALLPVGGQYTMGITEAVAATEVIDADIFIPMHYGSIIGDREDGYTFARQVKRGTARVLTPVY